MTCWYRSLGKIYIGFQGCFRSQTFHEGPRHGNSTPESISLAVITDGSLFSFSLYNYRLFSILFRIVPVVCGMKFNGVRSADNKVRRRKSFTFSKPNSANPYRYSSELISVVNRSENSKYNFTTRYCAVRMARTQNKTRLERRR